MEVSMHADYGFRVMMYLALSDHKLVQISLISDAYGISEHHLVKVIQRLTKLGYVQAIRGRNGGVRLAMAPDKINLGRVFRQMEPSLRLLECFNLATNTCPIVKFCSLSQVFGEALEAYLKVLDRKTLASILVKKQPLRKILNIAAE